MKTVTNPAAPKALAKKAASPLAAFATNVSDALAGLANALSNSPTVQTVTSIQMAIKSWEKQLKDVGDISKAILLDYLQQNGERTTEKGSLAVQVGAYQLEARPHRTGLDAKKVESLIRAKNLDVDLLMDKEISYILNETRLGAAVMAGQLSQEELDTCKYEVKYALQPIKKVG